MMGEIAQFPDYSPVDISIRDQLLAYTARYEPYSDFNYTNMVSWDVTGGARVALLNGNLVARFPDYLNGSEFYSYLGDTQVDATVEILLNEAERCTPTRELRLVPAVGTLALANSTEYSLAEDVDGHDYVISLTDIVRKHGSSFRHMRHEINHFYTRHGQATLFSELDLTDPGTQGDVFKVFLNREKTKLDNDHENRAESELMALGRLFSAADLSMLSAYGLTIDGNLKAFMISERIDQEWYTGHFWKADTHYRGIYRYLMHQVAERLVQDGGSLMNIEQDLGIGGLRRMKQQFNPISQLKKYTITDSR
ncbi:MAG TPA: phosphatidylglycerol lysyltransferase domain-containing protein [Candidatus Saccharimonadales bacterium]|jgi:hypothetical protein